MSNQRWEVISVYNNPGLFGFPPIIFLAKCDPFFIEERSLAIKKRVNTTRKVQTSIPTINLS